MIALHGYRLYWRERRAHRDTRAAYDSMVIERQLLLRRLTDTEAHVADLEQHLECMACDNADLERTVEAYTAGLRWFRDKEGAE